MNPAFSSLLTTKLYPPPARPSRVARPRLEALLNEACPLILVSAPAGYGKSTLVSQLASPFGWVALDADDNDPARFFTYVIAALQTAVPGLGEAALGLLQAPQPPLNHIVSLLINQLTQFQKPLAFVLDDYHLITSAPIHESLTYWLDHAPQNLRLIICTREDPPLPLARWRARQQLTEIRAAQLRFTPTEAAGLLNRSLQLNLTVEEVAALEQRTEGWAVGLQLAAQSLSEHGDKTSFITALAGSHRHIADYLMDEFFNRQPVETQTFLLHTSVLDRFSAPLCEAVLGTAAPSIQTRIEQLERENVLLVPLDADRTWWRYHALLAEALRTRLKQIKPDLWPALHTRASGWFEQNGYAEEAVHHALQASDSQNSARLIASFAPGLMKRDDFATLRRWLAQLPEAVIWADPRLCLAQIWALLDFNQPEAAQSYLDRVNELLANAHEPALQTEALTLRAIAEAMAFHSEAALALAEQAQRLNTSTDPLTRALLAYALGGAYKMGNDGLRAEHNLREAGLAALAAGSGYLAIEALGNLGDLQVDLGRLPEAEQTLRHALEQSRILTRVERPASGWLYWDLARIHYEWNELDQALDEATQSAALCALWGNQPMWVRALLVQAQVHMARGHWLAAQAVLDDAEQIAQRASGNGLRHMVLRRRLFLALARHDLPRAQLIADSLHGPTSLPYYQTLALARLSLAQGQPAQALDYLKLNWQSLEQTNLVTQRIQSLIIEALARRAMGQREQALLPLERALVMAQPGGFLRSFVEHGAPMQELLRRAAANSRVPVYAHHLLATFAAASPAAIDQPPLTQREREILHLLAAGLSNRQMSEQLVVTQATLKRHVSNLYLKLDVHSRTQALAKAGELKLL